jgi:hypothetical protein
VDRGSSRIEYILIRNITKNSTVREKDERLFNRQSQFSYPTFVAAFLYGDINAEVTLKNALEGLI